MIPVDDLGERAMEWHRLGVALSRLARAMRRLRCSASDAARAFGRALPAIEAEAREDIAGEEWKPPGWKLSP